MSSHAFNFTRLECTFHETPNLSIYDRKNMRSFERFLVPSWKSRGIGKNDWTAEILCDIRPIPSVPSRQNPSCFPTFPCRWLQRKGKQ
ncbi:hypothetical protein EHQ62_11540 [Leptospira jelokensis]|uniref:Uncharacterized protein n=1 Tax=Leptospira jelokensis TaxID=2484931 RepID=A0A4Z0ZR59_9LEPT|nr:hypothetical protein EHQ62_11540 [Leptospira jelokensis]